MNSTTDGTILRCGKIFIDLYSLVGVVEPSNDSEPRRPFAEVSPPLLTRIDFKSRPGDDTVHCDFLSSLFPQPEDSQF